MTLFFDFFYSHVTYNGQSRFCWTPSQQGLVLGAFYYGYIILQIPGGALSERYGSKLVLTSAIFLTSLFCVLTPIASEYSFGLLITIRVLQGLSSGVIFPSLPAMIKRLVESHRGTYTKHFYLLSKY